MGKGVSLSLNERKLITQKLGLGLKPCQIAEELKRDIRTINKAIENIHFTRKKRSDIGKSQITARDLRKIKSIMRKRPLSSSKTIFNLAGMRDIPKTTRNRVLSKVAKQAKPIKKPLLTAQHKAKCLGWCRKYMKLDFSNVIFTDESRVTLDCPDGWRKGRIIN